MWVGLHSGRACIHNSIFASRYMGLYPPAYSKRGGIYTFCEHFESTYMVAALRSYSTKRGISLHFFECVYVWVTHVSIDKK